MSLQLSVFVIANTLLFNVPSGWDFQVIPPEEFLGLCPVKGFLVDFVSWMSGSHSSLFYHFIIPKCTSGKEPACQCRRHKRCGFHPWVRKIPWRRAGNALQYPCLGIHGQSSLVGYSPWGSQNSQTWLKWLTTSPSASSCQWNSQIKGGNVWIKSRKSGTRQDFLEPEASHSTAWTLKLLICEIDGLQKLFTPSVEPFQLIMWISHCWFQHMCDWW